MSKKIPCGGFYLDDMLNVNDNGELSINGGTPYQQLVTDGSGNAKWEDRLAYEENISVNPPINITWDGNTEGLIASSQNHYYKVSDDIFPIEDVRQMTITLDGQDMSIESLYGNNVVCYNNAIFCSDTGPVISLAENSGPFPSGAPDTYPEVGVYFPSDGSVSALKLSNKNVLKKLDEKFLPSVITSLIFKSSIYGSTKKFKITVNDSGAITATEVT